MLNNHAANGTSPLANPTPQRASDYAYSFDGQADSLSESKRFVGWNLAQPLGLFGTKHSFGYLFLK
jgi:hypothetical protein